MNISDMHGDHNNMVMPTAATNSTDMHGGHNMTGSDSPVTHFMEHVTQNMPGGHDMSGDHSGGQGMPGNHDGGHNMSGDPSGGQGMPGNHDGGHDMSGEHSSGHSSYFHKGLSEYILVEDIHTDSRIDMIWVCVVVFVVAALYEGLKVLREELKQGSVKETYTVNLYQRKKRHTQVCRHLLQVFLHVIQVTVSYCLMMVFMTFNLWLCVAVVAGAGFGYLCFGWRRQSVNDANEHCH